jgi:sterol desaturase/sphingolipid hydroxylase (fatty acid hydroxylase superfamily)
MKQYFLQHPPFVFQNYRDGILLFLFTLIALEIIWSWRTHKKAYHLKETFANTVILVGFQFSKIIFAGYQLAILGFASKIALFKLPPGKITFIIAFIITDFIYYWFHRASHRWLPLWAFHHIHHSTTHMNLSSAYRLNWFSALVSPVFFLPMAIIGFPPDFIVLSYALNLLYQFFLHTEVVGKLGNLEGIVDTPSAHRVHHGSNAIYTDKNFGGVFMFWDKIFNTYQSETEKVQYGIAGEKISYNPFKLVFQGFMNLFRKRKATISTPDFSASPSVAK